MMDCRPTLLALIVILLLSTYAFASFSPADLAASATSHHRDTFDRAKVINVFGGGRGFTEWYEAGTVTIEGVPFAIPSGVLDCVSGSLYGAESYKMPSSKAETIYFLGTADMENKQVCDSLELFNIEIIYSDGSSEEILPVNIKSREPKWYDSQVADVSVRSFNTLCTFGGTINQISHVSAYAICPSRPGDVKAIIFNDNDHKGDYVIAAMTESDQPVAWIKAGQKVRNHPPATPPVNVKAGMVKVADKLLVDIGPYCNQNSTTCFDTGYGHGRGRVHGLKLYPGSGDRTIDGIPFKLPEGDLNVISGSMKSLESFTVPVDASAAKAYLLMTRYSETDMPFNSPDWADHPYYLSVDVVYEDGDYDTFFPKNVSKGDYKLYPVSEDRELAAYVVEPIDAKKKISAIRINDKLDDSDLVIAGVTLDESPSTVSVGKNTPVKWHKLPKAGKPKVVHNHNLLVIENAYYRVKLQTGTSLTLSSLYNKIGKLECLAATANPNMVSVVAVGGAAGEQKVTGALDLSSIGQKSDGVAVQVKAEKRYNLGDFEIEDVRVRESGNARTADIVLCPNDGAPFKLSIGLTADETPELRLSAQVMNVGKSTCEYKVFTYLTDIVMTDVEKTHYFYPPPRGTFDNRAIRIRKCYGGTTYMQLLDAYNPQAGVGIYLRPDDAWGQSKAISLCKSGDAPLIDDGWASYAAEMYVPAPEVQLSKGLYIGYEYWERHIEPGETSEIPEMVMGFHTGDWHSAFSSYRAWVQRNLPKIETPAWVKDGALMTVSHLGMHLGNQYHILNADGLDVFQSGMWWNQPNRPETGGRNEYFYREDWGGVDSLKKAVANAHARGIRVIFYLEGNMFPAQFERGADCDRLDPISARQTASGKLDSGSMCPGSIEWQAYLSATCGRLIRDTSADGVYLDSICQIPPLPCYKPEHNHKSPNQTWNHDVSTLLQKVRDAIKKENPRAALYSEAAGADVATALLDGSYSYYCNEEWVSPKRFGNPKLTGLTKFLFPGKRNWSLVGSLIDPPINTEAFFNGDYIFTQSSIGVARSSVSPYRLIPPPSDAAFAEVMKKHARLLGSSDCTPLISSEIKGVYINKFAAEDKVMYNVLNTNMATVRGELVEVDKPGKYVDELTGRPASMVKKSGKLYLSGRVGPKEVACFVKQD